MHYSSAQTEGKIPLLKKILSQCVEGDVETFVPTSELFEAYESAVLVWTDGNNQCQWPNKVFDEEKQLQ